VIKRILVVDDSSTARSLMKRCLEIAGCRDVEFVEAGNGKEAVDKVRALDCHLVVTDLNMPVLDGRGLVLSIKTSPRLNHIPIIVITSSANPQREQELLECGASRVLGKPIVPAALYQTLIDIFGDEFAP